MRLPRVNLGEAGVLWLGVFGAPAAWAIQHVTGFALTEAALPRGGRAAAGASTWTRWTIVVSATAAAVAVAAPGRRDCHLPGDARRRVRAAALGASTSSP